MTDKKDIPQKKKLSTSTILKTSVIAILLIASITALIIWHEPIFKFFSNREETQNFIKSTGIFAPLIFILLQVVEIIVAPIPGQITGLASGYLFGPWGILFSMIGASIGYTLVFMLSRRFGRPLIEKIFKKDQIKKFDYITESKGTAVLFLIFLLPFFPDDLICYLAGLTKIPIKNLIAVSLAGRFPGYLTLNLIGNGISKDYLNLIISIAIAGLILLGIAYRNRKWLENMVKSKNIPKYIKNNWNLTPTQTIIRLLIAIAIITALTIFALMDPLQL